MLKHRTNLMNDILQGKRQNEMSITADNMIGLELFKPLFCCMVHIDESDRKQAENDFSFSLMDILSSDPKAFVWDCNGNIGIILKHKPDEDSASAVKWLVDRIKAYDSCLNVAIGVGGVYSGFEGIRKSYHQATSAAVVAFCRKKNVSEICHFRQIGVYQFLEHFSDTAETQEFVHRQIGKLLAYDNNKGTDLLHTLEEILQSSSLKVAADKLYLHYNTLLFRKRRVEKILNVSINEFETRLALSTAIKLQHLISKKRETGY